MLQKNPKNRLERHNRMLEGIADVSKNDENPFYVSIPIVYIACIDSIDDSFSMMLAGAAQFHSIQMFSNKTRLAVIQILE